MKRVDGRTLAASIRADVAAAIAAKNLQPRLGVLLVGEDPASRLYVQLKEKAAAEVGIATDIQRLPATTSDEDLIRCIDAWNADPAIHGILVQLPLPEGHDTNLIIERIDPKKDADGFHPSNIEALLSGTGTIISPLHEGILRLIAATDIRVNASHVSIIGNSDIFIRPLAYLLTKAGAIVTTMQLDDLQRRELLTSQIIITAVGKPNLVSQHVVASGTCVIDVGTSTLANGHVVGDVDAASLEPLEGWLTPVPGGVGPMTIAMLLKNVMQLAEQR